MPLTSPGALRSAGRKAANSLRSNHPNGGSTHNGGGGTGSRALHTARVRLLNSLVSVPDLTHIDDESSNCANSHLSDAAHKLTSSLDAIRPRNPAHILFSSTKGFVSSLFNKLAAPGIRVPGLGSSFASRSLQQARPTTIQAGLSLHVRHAIRDNNFRSLGSGTFLPRAPQVPIRGPVASQVGLGSARNFSSSRPIFQNLVDNVPIAVRALYEADLDDLKDGQKRRGPRKIPVVVKKTKTSVKGSKLKAKSTGISVLMKTVEEEKSFDSADLERYFTTPALPAVTTQLLVPLAPTPTNRVPLSALDEYLGDEIPTTSTGRFLPLSQIGKTHQSHSNHALKVSTLFARLDQADVWSRGGVVCSAYAGPGAGIIRLRRRGSASEEDGIKLAPGSIDLAELEGVCTILKVEFQGWTAAEVRGVIGESGTGWCVLEEIWHNEEEDQGMLSAAEDKDSLFAESISGVSSPAFFASPPSRPSEVWFDTGIPNIDPAQSFVLPTLDFSASFPSPANERKAFGEREAGDAVQEATAIDFEDPWAEFETESNGYMSSPSSLSSLSRSSSFGSFEDVGLAAPPSAHSESSWSRFEFSSRFYDAASHVSQDAEAGPREAMF